MAVGWPETVGGLVEASAERQPERVAVMARDGGGSRTYEQLDARSTALANALLDAGLRPGERIATWVEDCPEYVELYLAAAKAGLVVAPINARFVAAEAAFLLEDCGARAIVWSEGLDAAVAAIDDRLRPELTISVGAARGAELGLEELTRGGERRRLPPPGPDDLAILGYTSGTSGRPKGAMLTHRGVVSIGRQNAISYRLSPHSVFALTGSMSFVAVVPAHVLCALGVGARLVMMGRYGVEDLIETIERERVTFTYVPSPLLAEFAAAAGAEPGRVASLDAVLHSASRADPPVLREACAALGGRLVEGWGMTEHSGGLATATTRGDYAEPVAAGVFETVGRPALGVSVRVRDEGGAILPDDGRTIGELEIRSPALATGYWNRPEESAAAFVDGWFRTGDLGSIDPEGYVTIADRRTDLIVSGGMNVYPSEVERTIGAFPGVEDVGVVGLPHRRWGRTVVAAVVAAGEIPRAELLAHCRSNLAGFKVPTKVVFMDDLPYTPNQKLSRRELRERLEAGAESRS